MVRKSFTPELARSAGLADNRFPQTYEEADKAEEVLTKELEKLSLHEHEKILFDAYGLSGTQEKDDETLQQHLKDLEVEISKIKRKKREAYERAKFLNRAYVLDDNFRLMFLRAEFFNAKAAAHTIVTHFDIKRKVFGDNEMLGRDIRMSDLNQEDLSLLRSGIIQDLPERDASGRAVFCIYLGFKRNSQLFSPLSRASWYFQMTVMKDEDIQKKGVVFVMYNYCHHREEVDFQREIHQLRAAMPYHTDAAHYCYDDPSLRPFVAGIRLFIDPFARFRLRPHYGTPEKIDFELQTFGIPTEYSPMQKDGTWSLEWHEEWLAMQKAREEKEAKELALAAQSNAIIVPRRFDVLFGRGKIAKTHTGNLRALHLCEMNYPRYESAITGKYGKTEVAEQIVRIIHESGGRFLKPENGGWVEVDDEAAREKISHFFRHMRHKVKHSLTNNRNPAVAKDECDTGSTSSKENKRDYPSEDENSQDDFTTSSPHTLGKKIVPAKRVTPCPSPLVTV